MCTYRQTNQPPIQRVAGALFLELKRPGLTTHFHLVPRSKTPGAIPPLPQYAFMAWCSVKVQGKFTLHFIDEVLRCYS